MALSLDYIAGIIDGEGTITFCVAKKLLANGYLSKSLNTRVKVPNCDVRLLKMLKKQFGGYLFPVKRRSKKHRIVWIWELCSARTVIPFLTQIEPRLIIKRKQAQIVLHMARLNAAAPHGGAHRKKPAWKKTIETRYLKRIRALNQRGCV
jgi:hypothetical protein